MTCGDQRWGVTDLEAREEAPPLACEDQKRPIDRHVPTEEMSCPAERSPLNRPRNRAGSQKPMAPRSGSNVRRKRSRRAVQQLPDKAEVGRLIKALHAELASSDPATAQETRRLCERMSGRAAERLGLFIYGVKPATTASITVLKAARVVGYEAGDPGAAAPPETSE